MKLKSYFLSDLVKEMNGCTHSDTLNLKVECGISVDSRKVLPGQLFFALSGPRFDGHDYIHEVDAKGALAMIVKKGTHFDTKAILVEVEDPFRALILSAKFIRRHFHGNIFSITGSAGKSSTKNILGTILGERTIISPASFNNLLGLSQTFWLLQEDTENLVLEMGMNASGEIKELCETFRPQYGCITNIGDAHVGKLGGEHAVYLAKKEMWDYFSENECLGIAVDMENEKVISAAKESGVSSRKWVKYSECDADVDVFLERVYVSSETAYLNVSLWIAGELVQVELPIYGKHQANNIAAAIAMALLIQVPVSKIKENLGGVLPAKHRGEVYQLSQQGLLIDESYNSNPAALRESLSSLSDINVSRRRVLILGDMAELGEFTKEMHQSIMDFWIEEAKRTHVDFVWLGVGEMMSEIANRLSELGYHAVGLVDVESCYPWVKANRKKGDLILVKGSRSMALDRFVEFFLKNEAAPK